MSLRQFKGTNLRDVAALLPALLLRSITSLGICIRADLFDAYRSTVEIYRLKSFPSNLPPKVDRLSAVRLVFLQFMFLFFSLQFLPFSLQFLPFSLDLDLLFDTEFEIDLLICLIILL